MHVPFTGNGWLDILLAVVFLIFGVYISFMKKSRLGWVIIAAAAYWAFLLSRTI